MIRIGYFIHKTPSGKLLVKLTVKKPPKIGLKVLDSGGIVIGNITDIIGNVSSPYAVVKPLKTEVKLNHYTELFIRSWGWRGRE